MEEGMWNKSRLCNSKPIGKKVHERKLDESSRNADLAEIKYVTLKHRVEKMEWRKLDETNRSNKWRKTKVK